jgi:hypothetical protein
MRTEKRNRFSPHVQPFQSHHPLNSPINKLLPTVCDGCYQQLMSIIDKADRRYQFTGIYCHHEKTLCLAEMNEDNVWYHLIGHIEEEKAMSLVKESFESDARD